MEVDLLAKGIIHFHLNGPNAPRIGFFCTWGSLDPQTGSRLLVGKLEEQHKDL
jgi:hypothetical protein